MPSLSTRQKGEMLERFLEMTNMGMDRTKAQKVRVWHLSRLSLFLADRVLRDLGDFAIGFAEC
jgi:hypothetical protein